MGMNLILWFMNLWLELEHFPVHCNHCAVFFWEILGFCSILLNFTFTWSHFRSEFHCASVQKETYWFGPVKLKSEFVCRFFWGGRPFLDWLVNAYRQKNCSLLQYWPCLFRNHSFRFIQVIQFKKGFWTWTFKGPRNQLTIWWIELMWLTDYHYRAAVHWLRVPSVIRVQMFLAMAQNRKPDWPHWPRSHCAFFRAQRLGKVCNAYIHAVRLWWFQEGKLGSPAAPRRRGFAAWLCTPQVQEMWETRQHSGELAWLERFESDLELKLKWNLDSYSYNYYCLYYI